MKSRFRILLAATIFFAGLALLFAALALPGQVSAQDKPDHNNKHHHYKFIDLGTFGGPASFIGTPNNVNPELSRQGTTGGASATSVSLTS
ncbi:MAG TPA: hypothetical protein VNW28_05090, partial [Chthoniobacterales bacterium]|nr:hypothetical protein [Chthoniobacterales bacterium]